MIIVIKSAPSQIPRNTSTTWSRLCEKPEGFFERMALVGSISETLGFQKKPVEEFAKK
jgi:hypothetical protein